LFSASAFAKNQKSHSLSGFPFGLHLRAGSADSRLAFASLTPPKRLKRRSFARAQDFGCGLLVGVRLPHARKTPQIVNELLRDNCSRSPLGAMTRIPNN